MELNFTLAELGDCATRLLRMYGHQKVWALEGDMGAGKTTLVHALCEVLGVSDTVSSPTFPVINQYQTADGQPVYHIDLYRLNSEEEAINAGVEDCLYSGAPCFVEWPQRAPGIFDEDTLYLKLLVVNDSTRTIQIS